MRVYVPATSTTLAAFADAGRLEPAVTAFAVTPGVREWYLDDDAEELEYAANGQAVRDDLDRGAVVVGAQIPADRLASIHVDDTDAESTVARAAAVVLEADLGSDSAQDIVDDAEGFELAWYAAQELDEVLATLVQADPNGS